MNAKEVLLDNILMVMEDKTFGKELASYIVGGPKKLQRLIEAGKIEAKKTSHSQNGKWYCNASQVLIHCRNFRKRKIKSNQTKN